MVSAARAHSGTRLRGVNLGGWLVLEKWMKPSLFRELNARDETTWCAELGRHAPQRLREHWNTFIVRDDFAWLAGVGINAIRIPVGHWIFGPPYPYHPKYGDARHPFVEGGIEVLDHAIHWANELGLKVILDLHAAPGCQNAFDNGGIEGVCEWHMRDEYVDHSVEVLGRLAERYRASACLHAIEMLNEPRWDVPTDFLKTYYRRAYRAIRAHCASDRVAVVIHDGFRSHRDYLGFGQQPSFSNVLFDVHRYQCFQPEDVELDIDGHLHKCVLWKNEADTIQGELALPAIVGEWSLMLPESTFAHMDGFQRQVAQRAYAGAQLLAFECFAGWFFWSYRTEITPAWCFRECVERGWLPARFQ
jgi:glucan 1,3-beta-glucosidase